MAVKQTAGRDALGGFASKFAELNDDVLFGQVWSREDKLSLRDRSKVNLAVQCVEIIAHLSAIGNLLSNQRIQLLKVDLSLTKLYSLHAAADIDANHAGYDLVLDSHGGADGTALAGVDIGHDPNLAAGKLRPIAHRLNLATRRLLQLVGIADGGVIQTLNGNHGNLRS